VSHVLSFIIRRSCQVVRCKMCTCLVCHCCRELLHTQMQLFGAHVLMCVFTSICITLTTEAIAVQSSNTTST